MTRLLNQSLKLPCGAVLPNRIAKSAMSEQLAEVSGSPSPALTRLYAAWGRGGTGLLITGNVMVDRRAYVEPRNVVLEDDRHLEAVARWARAGRAGGALMMMQINHPGRVATAPLLSWPVGPSAIRPQALGFNLRTPRALTLENIADLRRRYARTAELALTAGFDGVQIHAAHGYLLSQFLTPAANRRTDAYGGTPAGRRRLLIEIVDATRQAVGASVPIAVKLNSADFHRGGMSETESLDVALALEDAGIDLLEISGGNYEAPAMTGVVRARTATREAYFLAYAEQLRERSSVPLMLTGGIRTRAFMEQVLADGAVDVIGMARPLAIDPDLPARLLAGNDTGTLPNAPRVGFTPLDAYLQLAWHGANFRRIAAGKGKPVDMGLVRTLADAGTRITLKALSQI